MNPNKPNPGYVRWSHRLRLPLLFAATLFCSPFSRGSEDAFTAHLRVGIEEADRGDYSAAMADLRSALTLNPNSAEAWYQLGLLLGELGDDGSAETAFRRATSLNPGLARAHFNLGLALIANPQRKLDWPGAMAEFRDAIKYSPDYAEAYTFLGAGLANTGEVDAAIPELEHAVQLKPSLPLAHFNLAIALEERGRVEEAEREYRSAVSLRRDAYPEATIALGKLLFHMGKATEAERELEKALRLNSDLKDAHYALAQVLQSLKQSRDAAVEFDQFKELSQRMPDAIQSSHLSNIGLDLASRGDFGEAVTSLRKAIALKPDNGIPHYNLGLILADTGNLEGAVEELTKAIALMQGQSKPWFDLGRVLLRKGDKTGAVESLRWALRLSPSDDAIRSELASMGVTELPLSSISVTGSAFPKAIVTASSDTASAHRQFAAQLSARGDLLGAVGELLRSLALQPTAIESRRDLARAYALLHDWQHAILECRKIVMIAPEDAATHLELGRILLDQGGDAQEAVKEFQLALQYQTDSAAARTGLDQAVKKLSKQ